MFDQRFFASKLGLSALVSVAAMVAFNLFAMSHASAQPGFATDQYSNTPAIVVPMAELA